MYSRPCWKKAECSAAITIVVKQQAVHQEELQWMSTFLNKDFWRFGI